MCIDDESLTSACRTFEIESEVDGLTYFFILANQYVFVLDKSCSVLFVPVVSISAIFSNFVLFFFYSNLVEVMTNQLNLCYAHSVVDYN